MTIIETAKMNGLNPQDYLTKVFNRIHDHKVNRLDELLPWSWTPAAPEDARRPKSGGYDRTAFQSCRIKVFNGGVTASCDKVCNRARNLGLQINRWT